jgi:hypothetical protein
MKLPTNISTCGQVKAAGIGHAPVAAGLSSLSTIRNGGEGREEEALRFMERRQNLLLGNGADQIPSPRPAPRLGGARESGVVVIRPPNMMNKRSGVMLIECLVYIFVFAILLGGGMAAFYFCWDHTRAVIFTAGEIESTLHAGETWRADVRAATGDIVVENTTLGEIVRIPRHEKEIVYRFSDGELRREIPAQNYSRVLLPKVKTSGMKTTPRSGVTAWRWEMELTPRRKGARLPLLFTFEAVQPKP